MCKALGDRGVNKAGADPPQGACCLVRTRHEVRQTDTSLVNEGPGDSEFKVSRLKASQVRVKLSVERTLMIASYQGEGTACTMTWMLVLEKSLPVCIIWSQGSSQVFFPTPLGILFFLIEITLCA